MSEFIIIQGGMGFGVSDYKLAKIVSLFGKLGTALGTVSGVALEKLLVRTLQIGDPGGHIRRALQRFPFPEIAEKIINDFYVEDGVPKGGLYKNAPVFTINPSETLISLTICANFVFVWLAKEGHKRPVSINYLEKIAMPHIYAITGAILANVDFITMGAGIALKIPEVIKAIINRETVRYAIPVIGREYTHIMEFNPKEFFGRELPLMKRPGFIPIISSNLLANIFIVKSLPGDIYGFVVEEPTAGGHNAPPRKNGEYGPKDEVDYLKLSEILKNNNLPFWIGGSMASPEKLEWALSVGAAGIQVGSLFCLSDESNMDSQIKKQIRKKGFEGKLIIRTDMLVSPTGFPFKVAELKGTLSEKKIYEARRRKCNQGVLVILYEKLNGTIGYRCAAEPVNSFIAKGGKKEDTIGRACICNGLLTTVKIGNYGEPPIVTLGDDVGFLRFLMKNPNSTYNVPEAINWLLSKQSSYIK